MVRLRFGLGDLTGHTRGSVGCRSGVKRCFCTCSLDHPVVADRLGRRDNKYKSQEGALPAAVWQREALLTPPSSLCVVLRRLSSLVLSCVHVREIRYRQV